MHTSTMAQTHPSFRIETDVMLANQAEPFLQTVTLFHEGIAYDYSRNEPDRITVIHPAEDRIVFLDQKRELQSRVNLQDLQKFLEKARVEMVNSPMADALQDAQQVEINEPAQKVKVGQRFVRYEANYQATATQEVAMVYAAFANASAYINSWQAPDRNPPSFARVRFNQVLNERQAIPTEITRTTITKEGREHVLKSRLHANWQLSDEDRNTVTKFETMMQVFQTVEVAEFLSSGTMGPKTGSRQTVQR